MPTVMIVDGNGVPITKENPLHIIGEGGGMNDVDVLRLDEEINKIKKSCQVIRGSFNETTPTTITYDNLFTLTFTYKDTRRDGETTKADYVDIAINGLGDNPKYYNITWEVQAIETSQTGYFTYTKLDSLFTFKVTTAYRSKIFGQTTVITVDELDGRLYTLKITFGMDGNDNITVTSLMHID